MVGELQAVDDLGIGNNTIVIYTTDNGPQELLAGWRDDAVQQREEHQLGRRVSRAVPDPLAGRNQPGSVSTTCERLEASSRHWWLPPVTRMSKTSCSRAIRLKARPSKSISTAITSFPISPASSRAARGKSSSTSTTMATLLRCGTKTGRSCSRSSACKARCKIWAEPFTKLRVPKVFDLRSDPYRARGRYLEHLLRLLHGGRSGSIPRGAIRSWRHFWPRFKEFPPTRQAAIELQHRSTRRVDAEEP